MAVPEDGLLTFGKNFPPELFPLISKNLVLIFLFTVRYMSSGL